MTITVTMLWTESADNKLMRVFRFFPENRISHIKQIVSTGENYHDMSNPISRKKLEKTFKMLSAENFTQSAKHKAYTFRVY